MFSRSVRKLLPSSYQLVKVTSAQSSRVWPYQITTQIGSSRKQLPRLYSEQVNVEPQAAIVDYERIKNATTDSSVLIVDVREPNEVTEHGKIPNSINIPVGNVNNVLSLSEKEFSEIYNRPKPSADTELIFYCMIGKRSERAQQIASSLGFKNAKNYLGSWTDWANRQKSQ